VQAVKKSQCNPELVRKIYHSSLFGFAIVCNFSISLSQISLGIALLCAIYLYNKEQLELVPAAFNKAYGFLFLAAFLSVFQADHKSVALEELIKYSMILVFYLPFLACLTEDFKKKMLIALIATASLTSVFAIANVFAGNMLNDRAKGFFSTSITYGECQAMVALLIATVILSGYNNKKHLLALISAFILVTGAMISTMARGAWLGFACGLIVLTVRFPRKMLPLIMVLAVSVGPIIWFTPSLRSRIESLSLSRNLANAPKNIEGNFESAAMQSNFERLLIWTRGFIIASPQPNFGIGLKNVKPKYRELATDYEKFEDRLIYGHQHSNFMQFFVETGFLGLSAFFIFLIAFLRFLLSGWKADSSINTALNAGALAIFVCFIATGLTEHSWSDEEVAMMAFFLTGLLLGACNLKAIKV
jgi:O-antigen ligase